MNSIRVALVRPALILALLSTLGCRSFDHVELLRYSQQDGMPVSTASIPSDADPIGFAHVREDGFYLLGILPIIRVGLRGCLDKLVEHARSIGAHGIADVRFEVVPAEFFKFSAFPLPDWSARVAVWGTMYRRRRLEHPDGSPADGSRPEPDTIRTAPVPAPLPAKPDRGR